MWIYKYIAIEWWYSRDDYG